MNKEKDILKFVIIGSVDDGKSTLIGRLLYETNCIFIDQYKSIKEASKKKGYNNTELSLITDGLKSEREQGITIDVAYRYFATNKRKFIVADCPGHVQYTRNMVTGASNVQVSLVLLDAERGITEQSKRHAFISSLLQINHMLVVVNKMDKINYSKDRFHTIVNEYKDFLSRIDIKDVNFIPASALKGDNIVSRSNHMIWYKGETVSEYLENVYIPNFYNLVDFRFPVQMIIRNSSFRGYAGWVASGKIKIKDKIIIYPSMQKSKINKIYDYNQSINEAKAGESIVLTIEDDIDISRGDIIVKEDNTPYIDNFIDATICWFDDKPMRINKKYILKHNTNDTKAFISELKYIINVNTMHRNDKAIMKKNDIGRCSLKTFNNIFFDTYVSNNFTGNFILIDEDNFKTVGAGFITSKSKNITWEDKFISKYDRFKKNKHKGAIIWFTGLSGAGKTTIAKEVEKKLFNFNYQVILLDGDNIRHGLCNDLNFSREDRDENIRRIGEVGKILIENGFIVLCSFISPYKKQRNFVKNLIGKKYFKEIYIKCPIKVCEERDTKGLYKKFRNKEIPNLSGLGSPYEEPDNPDLILDTDNKSINECTKKIIEIIKNYEIS